ncbi:thiamine-phosphate kinase [Candidatus Woesearchaeota archaeon]|nr:thiamine-phosphate kinase [Candidatus Woesearchaeota archaeon]
MKLSQIGEFGIIDRIYKPVRDKDVIKGIGDDCAVLRMGGKTIVITTDTIVDGDHFSLRYFSPEQAGMKAIEINVSDIGSMGGIPKYALVSLVLPKDLDVKVIDGIYRGMRKSCRKHGAEIIGGNITHGKQLTIDIDMIGEVKKENLCLRGDAKPGDFILVTGDLGSSTAGLNLFLKGVKGFESVKKKHLEPKAKLHKVRPFLKHINAMIDISDGLASEVTHICEQSRTGAIIFKDNIPIKDDTRMAAEKAGKDALDYALYGGEDFELAFTVSEENLGKAKGFLVGEITKRKGVYLYSNGKEEKVKKRGYDHFG